MDDVKQVTLRLQDQKLVEDVTSRTAGIFEKSTDPLCNLPESDESCDRVSRPLSVDSSDMAATFPQYSDKLREDSTNTMAPSSSNVISTVSGLGWSKSLPLQIISDRMNVDVTSQPSPAVDFNPIQSAELLRVDAAAFRHLESLGGTRGTSTADRDVSTETDENVECSADVAGCYCSCRSCHSPASSTLQFCHCLASPLPPTPSLSTSDDEVCDVFFSGHRQQQQAGLSALGSMSWSSGVPQQQDEAAELYHQRLVRCSHQLRRLVGCSRLVAVAAAAAAELMPRPWLDFNKMQKTCLTKKRSEHHRRTRRVGRVKTAGNLHVTSSPRHETGSSIVALDPAVFSFRSIWLTRTATPTNSTAISTR